MSTGTLEGETQSLDAPALERSFARQHYIDWLRVLAVLLLFPFHTLRVYNAGELWYVKAARLSTAVAYLLDFISAWHMQLLFLLAGASTCFALRKRSNRQYVGERFVRLGVPFVFGVLVLVPPQCYYGARSNCRVHRLVLGLPLERRLLPVQFRGAQRLPRLLRPRPALVHPAPVDPVPASRCRSSRGGAVGVAAPSCRASLAVSGAPSGGWRRRSSSSSATRCPIRPGRACGTTSCSSCSATSSCATGRSSGRQSASVSPPWCSASRCACGGP